MDKSSPSVVYIFRVIEGIPFLSFQMHKDAHFRCLSDCFRRSNTRAQAVIQAWKQELSQQVESLNASFEEFKLFLKRLVEDLNQECCSYKGCSAQEVQDMIRQQCAHILQSIESECEVSITQAINGCTAQYENWNHLTLQLGKFTTKCTEVVYNHSGKCRQLTENAKKTFNLMLEQFDSDHQDIERAFDGLLEGVSAACEEDIDQRREEAVQLLTIMKDGFYTAKEKAMNFVLQQEQAIRDEREAHGASLLNLFQIEQPAVKSLIAMDADSPDATEGEKGGGELTAQDEECTAEVCTAGLDVVTIRDKHLVIQKDLLTVLLLKEEEPKDADTGSVEQDAPAEPSVAEAEQTDNSTPEECADSPDGSLPQVCWVDSCTIQCNREIPSL